MTQEITGTVVLGFGPQNPDWFGKALKVCGKKAVMCPDTARMAGANFAGGPPEALAELRTRLSAGALLAEHQRAAPGQSAAATLWLANGERGLSSESIFQHLTGIPTLDDHRDLTHPYDPADLRRCRLLLEQVPELQPLFRERMASASKEWAALVSSWDVICRTMDEEVPDWRNQNQRGKAVATYELIKKAIGR